jgi:hypothetical protein
MVKIAEPPSRAVGVRTDHRDGVNPVGGQRNHVGKPAGVSLIVGVVPAVSPHRVVLEQRDRPLLDLAGHR